MGITNAEANRVFAEVAKKNHTSVEEVKREIMLAMKAGMESEDPEVRKRWDKISVNRNEITPEMIRSFLTGELKKHHV